MSRLPYLTQLSQKSWYMYDATRLPAGRLAARISHVLQGKHKPIYDPAADCGDYVVVTNAARVALTGRKWHRKLYRWHTGYPGGLKQMLAHELADEAPDKVLWKAVYGMLPKNRLRRHRMQRLRIYRDATHPHAGLIAPTPAHLRLEPQSIDTSRVLSDEELARQAGHVVEWRQVDGDGGDAPQTHVVTYAQHAERIPKRPRKGVGLFKKGKDLPRDLRSRMKPVAQLPPFADIASKPFIQDAFDNTRKDE